MVTVLKSIQLLKQNMTGAQGTASYTKNPNNLKTHRWGREGERSHARTVEHDRTGVGVQGGLCCAARGCSVRPACSYLSEN